MTTTISIVRYRRQGEENFRFYHESLSLVGARSFVDCMLAAGGEAEVITLDLTPSQIEALARNSATVNEG